jgi:RNA polymerase sigma-70 factor, ECF subfamily
VTEADEALRLAAARAGGEIEFRALAEPYRRPLLMHCYRMLGRLEEAEDVVQETMLRAWRKLSSFEGRSSFRAWIYKIATHASIDIIARRGARLLPHDAHPPERASDPLSPPLEDATWLGPIPDTLLDSHESGEDAHAMREHVALAFLVALQRLPARQRVVLLLHDVVGWEAAEVAEVLDLSSTAVHSLLARARSELQSHRSRVPRRPSDEEQRVLLGRYVSAWESGDVSRLVALMKEDATMVMPPITSWFRGRQSIHDFILATIFRQPGSAVRLRACASNGVPAFAFYCRGGASGPFVFFGVQLLALDGDEIAGLTTFIGSLYAAQFQLPAELA